MPIWAWILGYFIVGFVIAKILFWVDPAGFVWDSKPNQPPETSAGLVAIAILLWWLVLLMVFFEGQFAQPAPKQEVKKPAEPRPPNLWDEAPNKEKSNVCH